MMTDAQILDQTVATVQETSVGTINVPSGRVYQLTGLFGAHTTGGVMRYSVDTYPSLQGQYIQNSTDITQIGNTNVTPLNLSVRGPAEIQAFVTNNGAGTGTARVMFQYIDRGQGSTN